MTRRAEKSTKAKAKPGQRRPSRKSLPTAPDDIEKRLTEALAQQAATSDILSVIRRSPTDAQPVFDMIAERAMRLCGALHAGVLSFDGELIHLVAHVATSAEFMEQLRHVYPIPPTRGTAGARAILTRATVHIPDLDQDPEYELAH